MSNPLNFVSMPLSVEGREQLTKWGKIEAVAQLPEELNRKVSELFGHFISSDDKMRVDKVECHLTISDMADENWNKKYAHFIGQNKIVMGRSDDGEINIKIQVKDGAIFKIMFLD